MDSSFLFCSIYGMKKRVEIMKQKTRERDRQTSWEGWWWGLLWDFTLYPSCDVTDLLQHPFSSFLCILFVIKGLHSILFPSAFDCSQSNWGWKVFLFSRDREETEEHWLVSLALFHSHDRIESMAEQSLSGEEERRRRKEKKREGEDESQGFFLFEHHHDVGGEEDWRKGTRD